MTSIELQNLPRINAIGTYVPELRESNYERAASFGFPGEFLQDVLGFVSRSVKDVDERTSDLCIRAFDDLCLRTGFEREQIQLLAVVTQNPDVKIPHTAAIVHNRLELSSKCMTFDISQGCAGYCHGVAVIIGLMETLKLRDAVLFTADPYMNIIDHEDKDVALLFGDAATATYFTRESNGYLLADASFGTLPNSHDCLRCDSQLTMDGQAVFNNAAKQIPASILELLDRNDLNVDNVDHFILHQASKYIVEFIRTRLKVSPNKAPFSAAEYGNTISSSIPLLLQESLTHFEHEVLLLSGFGVGFSWGNNLLNFIRDDA